MIHYNKENLLFYVGCYFICFFYCLRLSSLGSSDFALTFFQYCQYAGYALLALRVILFTRYWTTKYIFFLLISLSSGFACFLFCKSLTLLLLVVFCAATIHMNFSNVCKSILFSLTTGIFFVIFLYSIGIIDGRVLQTVNPLTGAEVSRNALGFRHQNYLGKLVLAAFAAYWYLRFKKIGIQDIALALTLFLLLYFVVNTKTTSMLIIFALFMTLLIKRPKGHQWCWFFLAAFIVLQITEIIAVFAFDPTNSLLKTVNSLMSTRLSAAHSMIQDYPITLFGQEVEIISSIDALRTGIDSATLDICFFNALLNYGIIPLSIIIIAWTLLIRIALDSSRSGLFLVSLLILFSGLFEAWCISLPTCFVLSAIVANTNSLRVQSS